MIEARLGTLVRQVRRAVRASDEPCDRELLRAYAAGQRVAFDDVGLGLLVLFAVGLGLAAYSAAVGPPPAYTRCPFLAP